VLLSGRKWNEGDQELISGDLSWSLIKVVLLLIAFKAVNHLLLEVLEFDAGWGVAARTHFIISSLFFVVY